MIPEWLPDWKDSAQYPEPKSTPRERWAWEFLRRNPEYQADYAALKSAEPLSMEQLEWSDELMDKYEAKLIDPATPQPELLYFFRASYPPRRVIKQRMPDELERYSPIQYYEFDLRKPIKQQVEAAREAMEWHYKEYRRIGAIDAVYHRAQTSKYKTYLRLLDADLDNASMTHVAKLIYGKGGQLSTKDTQGIKDDLKAAKLLRDFNYRFIPSS